MELTASKTASCTIAAQRVWWLGLLAGVPPDAVTVSCMILFQSVTVSARPVVARAGASTIASKNAAIPRKSFDSLIGFDLSLGLRYDERTSCRRADRAPEQCRAGEELT